jgi:hypothetical protein
MKEHVRSDFTEHKSPALRGREIRKFLEEAWSIRNVFWNQDSSFASCPRHGDDDDYTIPNAPKIVVNEHDYPKEVAECSSPFVDFNMVVSTHTTFPDKALYSRPGCLGNQTTIAPKPCANACDDCEEKVVDLQVVFDKTVDLLGTIGENEASVVFHSRPEDDFVAETLMNNFGERYHESEGCIGKKIGLNEILRLGERGVSVYAGLRVHSRVLLRELKEGMFYCFAMPTSNVKLKCRHGKSFTTKCCTEFLQYSRCVYQRPLRCSFEILGCIAASRLAGINQSRHGLGWAKEVYFYCVEGVNTLKYGRTRRDLRIVYSPHCPCIGYSVVRSDTVLEGVPRRAIHDCGEWGRKVPGDHLHQLYYGGGGKHRKKKVRLVP